VTQVVKAGMTDRPNRPSLQGAWMRHCGDDIQTANH